MNEDLSEGVREGVGNKIPLPHLNVGKAWPPIIGCVFIDIIEKMMLIAGRLYPLIQTVISLSCKPFIAFYF